MDLKELKIKNFKKEIEPQDVLLDFWAQKREKEYGFSEKRLENPLSKRIFQIFCLSFFILMLILFGKSLHLQILQGKELSQKATANKVRIYFLRPNRGVIYDRNLRQLVFNKPSFDLICNKKEFFLNNKEGVGDLEKISKIIQVDFNILKEKIENSKSSLVLISENIDHDTLISFETEMNDISTCYIEKNTVRNYIDGPIFSHLIGYTGKISPAELKRSSDYSIADYIGKTGLEKEYEKILRGRPGQLYVEKNAFGEILKKEKKANPEPGKSLVLWLDSNLQKKITQILEKNIKKIGAKKASAVALDPNTGGVLALVSLPNFDNNKFAQGITQTEFDLIQNDPLKPLFNRAISGLYPTGSIIKPLIGLAALEEKIISPEKQIYAKGFIKISHQYNPEIIYTFKDWKVHGWTDLRKAIAQSVNVYFYAIGGGYEDIKGLGPSRIKEYLQLFGWGRKTQIDLPGEAQGLIPDPIWKKNVKKENWWDGDTYLLSIGQGPLLVTPLQVAASFVPIANGGKFFQPQIVHKIITGSSDFYRIVKEIKPKIIRKISFDLENLQEIKEGMRQAVTKGISRSLKELPVAAAAKTGTAQTSKKGFYHHWIVVFAPYENPEIVLTILVEEIKEGFVGVTTSIAKEILNWYFNSR